MTQSIQMQIAEKQEEIAYLLSLGKNEAAAQKRTELTQLQQQLNLLDARGKSADLYAEDPAALQRQYNAARQRAKEQEAQEKEALRTGTDPDSLNQSREGFEAAPTGVTSCIDSQFDSFQAYIEEQIQEIKNSLSVEGAGQLAGKAEQEIAKLIDNTLSTVVSGIAGMLQPMMTQAANLIRELSCESVTQDTRLLLRNTLSAWQKIVVEPVNLFMQAIPHQLPGGVQCEDMDKLFVNAAELYATWNSRKQILDEQRFYLTNSLNIITDRITELKRLIVIIRQTEKALVAFAQGLKTLKQLSLTDFVQPQAILRMKQIAEKIEELKTGEFDLTSFRQSQALYQELQQLAASENLSSELVKVPNIFPDVRLQYIDPVDYEDLKTLWGSEDSAEALGKLLGTKQALPETTIDRGPVYDELDGDSSFYVAPDGTIYERPTMQRYEPATKRIEGFDNMTLEERLKATQALGVEEE